MKALFSAFLVICFIFITLSWSQSKVQSQFQVKEALIAGGTIVKKTIHNNYKLSATAGQAAIDSVGNSNYSILFGFWSQYPIIINPVGIGDSEDLLFPKIFELKQNYPNPFNPVTTIEYSLPRLSDVTIEIYNILGQQVVNLLNEKQPAGYYSVRWGGINSKGSYVANGMYFYRMVAQSTEGEVFVSYKKMLFIK